jgi:hypothetical protein
MKSYQEGTFTIQEFLHTIAALYQPLEVCDEDRFDDDDDVSPGSLSPLRLQMSKLPSQKKRALTGKYRLHL